MERKKITFDSFIRGAIICGVVIAILMLLKRLSSVLLPFFIAWLAAYLIYPLVTFFQHRLKLRNRALSIFCALLLLAAIGTAAFYLLVPPMVQEFSRVKDLLMAYFTDSSYGSNVPRSLSDFLRENIDPALLKQLFQEKNLLNMLKEAVPPLWSLVTESINLIYGVFTIFIILLYIVFILLDYESISEGWPRLLPAKYRPFLTGIMNDVKEGMNKYFRGQAFVALCVGILFSIGFLIIDFPLAIGLGLFIGFLNLVPYLQIIGFIPTIILAILKAADTGGNFWIILAAALAVFLAKLAVQFLIVVGAAVFFCERFARFLVAQRRENARIGTAVEPAQRAGRGAEVTHPPAAAQKQHAVALVEVFHRVRHDHDRPALFGEVFQ